MKTLLGLLVVLCVILVGNTHAQNLFTFKAETQQELVPKPIEIGDAVPLKITLTRNNRAVAGVTVSFRPEDPAEATVNPSKGTTNARGMVTTNVTFHKGGEIDIFVDAPAHDSSYTHTFKVSRQPVQIQLTRIVATPVKKIVGGQPTALGEIAVGDTVRYQIEIKGVSNLAAWQMDIVFNPEVLEFVEIREGDFLERNDVNAFFQGGTRSSGKIAGIRQARIGRVTNAAGQHTLTAPVAGVNGTGTLLEIDFKVLEFAEEALGLHNVHLSDSANFTNTNFNDLNRLDVPNMHFNLSKRHDRISYYIVSNPMVVTQRYPLEDVNRDRHVNIQDLVVVAGSLGKASNNPRADVNNDGFVNMQDLILVARHPNWGKRVGVTTVRAQNSQIGTAPSLASGNLTPETIQGWIDLARVEDDGSVIFDRGVTNLENLLGSMIPSETRLLLNYPNPFNPETWIPYQLAKSADVTLSIYSVQGTLVRTLALGHQPAGVYQSKSQAAYWDGQNELGEQVASGVYFYTLVAGNFSATGKMLVRK